MNKYSLDASAILHAWDEYPIGNFPRLWGGLETRLQNKDIIILRTAFDESKKTTLVENKETNFDDSKEDDTYEKWLKGKDITIDPINQEIIDLASEIKQQIGIFDDLYHPNGVSENDIFITAHAKCVERILITEESRQFILPVDKKKYKIPAVCDTIGSESCRFIDFIKASGERF